MSLVCEYDDLMMALDKKIRELFKLLWEKSAPDSMIIQSTVVETFHSVKEKANLLVVL